MGDFSFEIGKQLKILLQNNHPQIKFTFVFTNTSAKFIKQPTDYSSDLCSKEGYLFTCPNCQVRYVESMSQWLCHRILEHESQSFRTGLLLSRPSFSSTEEHSTSLTPFL